MKRIFEKIRNFWKREKGDIKKNYSIGACVNDCDSKTLKEILDDCVYEPVYIVYMVKEGEYVPDKMIGFRNLKDAELYLENVGKHYYPMGYRHVGIKRCSITKYIDGIHDVGVEGEPGVEGKMPVSSMGFHFPDFEVGCYPRRELNEYGKKMLKEIQKKHNIIQQVKNVEDYIKSKNL